ncbi:PREDICTED: 15-hydroxyprostaglandin dehydrogenase [NAD(+)]-like [Nicrophorus vespilloides]|uniref:15-hydroxyprostaglandin dehydrogenase [NAD(+)]-like n=1 Tax=Nicrophorus vespilloides TaxID=110193 RepID=A0ABM1MHE2_NICVS|nr:PREDICTED: 15-hydroxyprostaglandin dehydrogenase [NAD(+)]-like [Nicrophorus vespilloides]
MPPIFSKWFKSKDNFIAETMFPISEKVALVTGALGGIGQEYIRALLQNNIKGVALVDINDACAEKFIEDLKKCFRGQRLFFIKADVTDLQQLEDAYKKTIDHFHHLDIVVNNAGVLDERNFERTLNINLIATIRSTYLAFNKYLKDFKGGDEAVVVNTSSIVGLMPYDCIPTYSLTKRGVITLGMVMGTKGHYERTKVKIITICPGGTETPMLDMYSDMPDELAEMSEGLMNESTFQSPEFLGKGLIKILHEATNGSVWICQNCQPATQVHIEKNNVLLKSKH